MRTPADHRCRIINSPWHGVYCTYVESARHYRKHWHTTYGLGLVEHGAQASASGRGAVTAYAGELITTNPGEVHDGRPLGGPSRRWRIVYFDPGIIASLGVDPGTSGVPHAELTRPVIKDHELGLALRELFARLENWSIGRSATNADVMACEESLVCTFGLLLSRYATASCSAEVCADVRRARDRLADELVGPPTLAELALMAGVSKYQLLRRFEKAFGVPPSAWLRMQRTERARALIADGQSLARAAASCGFADQSHMTRNFVDQFGFTPGAWQRTVARAWPQATN